jgi:hypothetical protein
MSLNSTDLYYIAYRYSDNVTGSTRFLTWHNRKNEPPLWDTLPHTTTHYHTLPHTRWPELRKRKHSSSHHTTNSIKLLLLLLLLMMATSVETRSAIWRGVQTLVKGITDQKLYRKVCCRQHVTLSYSTECRVVTTGNGPEHYSLFSRV